MHDINNESMADARRDEEILETSEKRLNNKLETYLNYGLICTCLIAYHVWLVFACSYNFDKVAVLFWVTVISWVFTIFYCIAYFYGEAINEVAIKPLRQPWASLTGMLVFRIVFAIIAAIGLIAFFIWDTWDDPSRLRGLGGMAFYFGAAFLLSNNKKEILWRPVFVGFALQLVCGLLVLRWRFGNALFQSFSNGIVRFISYSDNGTAFVYGFLAKPPNICDASGGQLVLPLTFTVFQALLYFSAIVSLLYYYGVIQWVLKLTARFLELTISTTATESLFIVACMAFGMTEAPLLIRPYIVRMTMSELHAAFTCSLSVIAGTFFAVYASFGACPIYLLSATIMSGCASISISKIMWPETEHSHLKSVEDLELADSEDHSAISALSNGAVQAINIVLVIAANLVVFVAILAMIDDVCDFLGNAVGSSGWTLQRALGYVFYPLAWVMGVESSEETFIVAQLMGTKTAVNEFIAYRKLSVIVANNGLSTRATTIVTYALCGFANFGSVAILIATFVVLCPERKHDFPKLGLRCMIGGLITGFFNASLAGVLIKDPVNCPVASSTVSCFDVSKFLNFTASGVVHNEL